MAVQENRCPLRGGESQGRIANQSDSIFFDPIHSIVFDLIHFAVRFALIAQLVQNNGNRDEVVHCMSHRRLNQAVLRGRVDRAEIRAADDREQKVERGDEMAQAEQHAGNRETRGVIEITRAKFL